LPFLTALAPAERYQQARGQQPKTLTDWARQLFLVVRRWPPEHPLVVATDRSSAVMTPVGRGRPRPKPGCGITRVRRDAAPYDPAPPQEPRQGAGSAGHV
jgi:hypothetical protein